MTTGFLRRHYAAPRFRPFQLIEGGWLLVVAAPLPAATTWFVRHRDVTPPAGLTRGRRQVPDV